MACSQDVKMTWYWLCNEVSRKSWKPGWNVKVKPTEKKAVNKNQGGTQVVLNSSLVTSFSMAQELKPFDLLDKEHIRELHYGHK